MFYTHLFGELISIFTPTVYEGQLGLTLDIQIDPLLLSVESERSQRWLMMSGITGAVQASYGFAYAGLKCHNNIKQQFGWGREVESTANCQTFNSWWSNTSHWFQEYLRKKKKTISDTPADSRKQVNAQQSDTPRRRALTELLSLRENLWEHSWIFFFLFCSGHELIPQVLNNNDFHAVHQNREKHTPAPPHLFYIFSPSSSSSGPSYQSSHL